MSRCSPTQHGSVQLHITAPALGDCSPGGPSRSVRTARRYPCRRRSVPPDPHHDRVGRRDYCRCRRASRARSSAVSFCRAYLQKHHLTLRQRGIRAGLLTPLSFSSCDAARFRSAVATRKREGRPARFVEFQQPPVCACVAQTEGLSESHRVADGGIHPRGRDRSDLQPPGIRGAVRYRATTTQARRETGAVCSAVAERRLNLRETISG